MVVIKDLPISLRPRERLINDGIESLNDEELLAILLKTGTKNESAKDLACKVLKSIESIENLKNYNYEQLIKINGIGLAKACSILASIELGKRVYQSNQSIKSMTINSTDLVYKYYKNIIGDAMQECFCCIYLDSQKKVINTKTLFVGTLNYSMVHPREVFKMAYLYGAVSIICIHNHPSGNPMPSKEDFLITQELVNIGKLLDVRVLDHIIIGKNNYYSFLENGDINNDK